MQTEPSKEDKGNPVFIFHSPLSIRRAMGYLWLCLFSWVNNYGKYGLFNKYLSERLDILVEREICIGLCMVSIENITKIIPV